MTTGRINQVSIAACRRGGPRDTQRFQNGVKYRSYSVGRGRKSENLFSHANEGLEAHPSTTTVRGWTRVTAASPYAALQADLQSSDWCANSIRQAYQYNP
jgi:hypothetical protein